MPVIFLFKNAKIFFICHIKYDDEKQLYIKPIWLPVYK